MNVGDTVWWTGAAPIRPRKVQLIEERETSYGYETIGGADGWQSRDAKRNFTPVTSLPCPTCGRDLMPTDKARFRPHNAPDGSRCLNREPDWMVSA